MNVESPRVTQEWNAPQLQAKKPLTLLPLIALIFYDVSGGPFGIEDAVNAGGPLLAILGFLLLPLAWSVPEALITSELATAFPENSGFVAWVTAAFGPWWGFQEGFWKWLSGVTDNAVYPVIFLTYLQQVVPVLETGFLRLYDTMCIRILNSVIYSERTVYEQFFFGFDVQPSFDCRKSGTHLPELQGASCRWKCSDRHDDIHSLALWDHVSYRCVN